MNDLIGDFLVPVSLSVPKKASFSFGVRWSLYHIRSIRHHGYYLFHQSIFVQLLFKAATIREWRLFNSLNFLGNLCTKGLEFDDINSELACGDLVSEQNFQHLDQLGPFDKAVPTTPPIRFLIFFCQGG